MTPRESVQVLRRRRAYLRRRIERKERQGSSAPMDKMELEALEWALAQLTTDHGQLTSK